MWEQKRVIGGRKRLGKHRKLRPGRVNGRNIALARGHAAEERTRRKAWRRKTNATLQQIRIRRGMRAIEKPGKTEGERRERCV